jgi:hypothetical protein
MVLGNFQLYLCQKENGSTYRINITELSAPQLLYQDEVSVLLKPEDEPNLKDLLAIFLSLHYEETIISQS